MRSRHAHLRAPAAAPWLLLMLISPAAHAQVSAWLQFDPAIKGDATNEQHKDWIDIESFQVGTGRGISSITGGAGRESSPPSLSEVTVTKLLDRSSPGLFAAITAGGDPYPKVTLDLNSGSSVPLARLELESVLVSGQTFSSSSGGSQPTESISLNFTKITFTYFMPDSPDKFWAYDILKNEPSSSDPVNPDTDNDGLPDAWETAYGLGIGTNDSNSDPDGDGLTNLQEFQLGTHPKSGTSFFKAVLTPAPATPGSYQLTWNSVAGKTYVIEWSADLKTPFTPLRTVTATAASTTENVAKAGSVGFYRVRPQ